MMTSLLRAGLSGYSGASNLAFNETINKLKSEGADIVHLGFGQSPFPVPGLLVDRLAEFAHVNDYLSVAGDFSLRSEICKFHGELDNLDMEPENLIVGPGSKSLIFLVLEVYGGTVWLAAPAWTTYFPQARLARHQPRIIEQKQENGWKLTAEDVEKGLGGEKGPHLLIFTNPGNPSGAVYSRDELLALVKVFKKHDVIVLSDEIYARLCFDGNFVSIGELYPEKTILTSGFSKWFGVGGWRLGYAHFPPSLAELKGAVLSAASHTHSCAPAPVQMAVARALQEDKAALTVFTTKTRKILDLVSRYCHQELAAVGVSAQMSRAGYYFMPDFSCIREELAELGVHTGQQLCTLILKEWGVALMPSSSFLMKEDDLSVRFCFVAFDGKGCLEKLQDGEDYAGEKGELFVKENCPDIAKGVQRLVNLVNKLKCKQ